MVEMNNFFQQKLKSSTDVAELRSVQVRRGPISTSIALRARYVIRFMMMTLK